MNILQNTAGQLSTRWTEGEEQSHVNLITSLSCKVQKKQYHPDTDPCIILSRSSLLVNSIIKIT